MRYIKKKIMLKGRSFGILNIEGADTAAVNIEWIKNAADGEVFLFSSCDKFCEVRNGVANIPAESVCAASVGTDLSIRGQLVPFDWNKAEEAVNMFRFIKNVEKQNRSDKVINVEPEQTVCEKDVNEDIYDDICPMKKQPAQKEIFCELFPDSVWYEHEYLSSGKKRRYLTGIIYENGKASKTAAAVPGNYSLRPPPWLEGQSQMRLLAVYIRHINTFL